MEFYNQLRVIVVIKQTRTGGLTILWSFQSFVICMFMFKLMNHNSVWGKQTDARISSYFSINDIIIKVEETRVVNQHLRVCLIPNSLCCNI